jgi:hypothetical protein
LIRRQKHTINYEPHEERLCHLKTGGDKRQQ